MCGIVYVQRTDGKSAVKQVLKRYNAQKSRGREGFGYVAVKQSGRATLPHRFMFEHEVETALQATTFGHILFHHRYPTSTPNVPEAAHPIRVTHQELQHDYVVVHNGVISNDEELKERHEALGYKYTTEISCQYRTRKGKVYEDSLQWNDSEALAIDLARNIEGLQKRVNARGAIAYIVMQLEKSTQRAVALYYGTNGGNPLTLDMSKDFICLASQGGTAINDNICYRMSLPDNTTTEYPQVQMQSAYTPTSAAGYMGTGSRYVGSLYDEEYAVDAKKKESKSLTLIEEELEAIDEELIGLIGDIELARADGDAEEEASYIAQRQELIDRRRKLSDKYLNKANAII